MTKIVALRSKMHLSLFLSVRWLYAGTVKFLLYVIELAWHQTANGPLFVPMMTEFTDAYMRHSSSVSLTMLNYFMKHIYMRVIRVLIMLLLGAVLLHTFVLYLHASTIPNSTIYVTFDDNN